MLRSFRSHCTNAAMECFESTASWCMIICLLPLLWLEKRRFDRDPWDSGAWQSDGYSYRPR
jgi:hypothetical protein